MNFQLLLLIWVSVCDILGKLNLRSDCSILAILVWMEKDAIQAFWSHMITICAILAATFISILTGGLSKWHAYDAAILVASRRQSGLYSL